MFWEAGNIRYSLRKIILLLLRMVFLGLVSFEVLNGIGIIRIVPDYSWLGLIYTGMVGFVAAEVFIRLRLNVDPLAIMIPVLSAVSLDAFGDIWHLYTTVNHYDKVLHFVNSEAITYLAYLSLRTGPWPNGEAGNGRCWFFASFAACIGITLGTLYEIEEFLEDQLVNHRPLRFGDSFDTGGDLLMNVLGCITMAAILCLWNSWKIREGK